MSRPTKHRIAMLLALGVIAISSEIKVLPGVLSPPSRAEQAKDWVRLHAAELPGTLDEISSYPTPLRREIFAALPADAKSSLWREQLRRVRHTRNGLTARQREFLERLDNTLTPELYADRKVAIERPSGFNTLCAEAKALFPGEQELFGRLGPERPTYASFESKRLRVVEWARELVAVHALNRTFPECECSVGSWCTCGGCHEEGCNIPSGGGYCGCLWLQFCDGMC